jgi:hypothetical protein
VSSAVVRSTASRSSTDADLLADDKESATMRRENSGPWKRDHLDAPARQGKVRRYHADAAACSHQLLG